MGSHRTLAKFGEQYRVRVKCDECGDSIVRGRFGHLYEHDETQLGIVLDAQPDTLRSDRTLRARRRRAIAAGFVVHQEGECEAILLFDPSDQKQAALAIRLIGAKKIRKVPPPTDAQLRSRALFSSRARSGRLCLGENTNGALS